ncbi:hypothetical protein ACOMHN_042072 [Nucella lapillus]
MLLPLRSFRPRHHYSHTEARSVEFHRELSMSGRCRATCQKRPCTAAVGSLWWCSAVPVLIQHTQDNHLLSSLLTAVVIAHSRTQTECDDVHPGVVTLTTSLQRQLPMNPQTRNL